MALCPYANIQTFEINLMMMNIGAGPRLKGNVRFTSRNIVSLVWQNDGRKKKRTKQWTEVCNYKDVIIEGENGGIIPSASRIYRMVQKVIGLPRF